jgi:spermidine synthase
VQAVSHVWGSSSLAFAAVSGSFLLGLGLGAYAIGRFSDRLACPLRWYGRSELAIGVLALLIPFEITAMVDVFMGLYCSYGWPLSGNDWDAQMTLHRVTAI